MCMYLCGRSLLLIQNISVSVNFKMQGLTAWKGGPYSPVYLYLNKETGPASTCLPCILSQLIRSQKYEDKLLNSQNY